MGNEIFFLSHIACVLGFIILSCRVGKEALISLVALQAVLANLFVTKQIHLFGLCVTCSDVFAVGSILGMNLLQEHFGPKEARSAIKISFIALVFFTVMSQIHIWYTPAVSDHAAIAFETILGTTPRIVSASIGVFFVVQQIDIRWFSWLQRRFQGKYLPLRILLSLSVTQLIDTVLFSFFGLYGIVTSIIDVIILSFCIKCIVIMCSSLFVALTRPWVSRDVSV